MNNNNQQSTNQGGNDFYYSQQNDINQNGQNYNSYTPLVNSSMAYAGGKPVGCEEINKKTNFIKKHPVIFGATVLLIVVICLVANALIKESRRVKINLNDYIVMEYEGYDGYGTAWAYVPYFDICEMYSLELELDTSASKERFCNYLSNSIKFEINVTEGLKNGDVIVVTWMVDKEKIEEKYNCRIECKKEPFVINGLAEIEEYNPFDDLEVEFVGTAPNGYITWSYGDLKYSFIKLTSDKSGGLRNGDTVTLSIQTNDSFEENCLNNGVKITCYEKEYTVEGIPGYVEAIAEIPEDGLNSMKSQAEDVFNAYVAEYWENPETMKAFNYMGAYYLTTKDYENYDEKNKLIMVYKVDVETENDSFSYYYYVTFYDLMLLGDGTFSVDISNYDNPKETWFDEEEFKRGGLVYCGYEKLESLFSNQVTVNVEYYNYESSVSE